MPQPLISVIVPVYNVEKYLTRCVESLLAQTLQEIEIILVDDGSPDASGSMCDAFAARDSRVIVVHKENGGLPSARNAGIARASGEYVGFVDSDDWVSERMFEALYRSAKRLDADVAICDYMLVSSKCTVIAGMPEAQKTIGRQILHGIKPIACNKIFRRSKGIRFYEQLHFAEDRPTVIPFLTKSNQMAYVPEPLYYYFQRNESIVDGYSRNACFSYDIQSMRLTIRDSEIKYKKQVVKYCVDTILWTINNKTRNTCKADMIEYLQELTPLLVQNRYMKQCGDLTKFLMQETIPRRLVYSNFVPEAQWSETQQICRRSWDKFAAGLDFVGLDESNCELAEAPACVQKAYRSGDLSFVGDYFRLKDVYEHGGIAIDPCIRLNLPIGGLRAEQAFFGYRSAEEISGHIFGSVAKKSVLKRVLETYETDNILNDDPDWTLGERIQSVLKQFGLREHSGEADSQITDDIHVYSWKILSYRVCPEQNVAQIYHELVRTAEQSGFLLMESFASALCSENANRLDSNTQNLRYEVQQLQAEVNRLKNSRSWKITRPLRMFFNLFRKVKYSEKEIR